MFERVKNGITSTGKYLWEKRYTIAGTALALIGGALFIGNMTDESYAQGFLDGQENATELIRNSKVPNFK